MTVRPDLHVGDTGTELHMVITNKANGKPVSLQTATEAFFKFKPPQAGSFQRDAEVVTPPGTDGKLGYTFVTGDLAESGRWKIQAFVKDGAGQWHTDIEIIDVGENIAIAGP